MDERTRAQVSAHHRVGRHWGIVMCSCGARWSHCPDAEEARRASAGGPDGPVAPSAETPAVP